MVVLLIGGGLGKGTEKQWAACTVVDFDQAGGVWGDGSEAPGRRWGSQVAGRCAVWVAVPLAGVSHRVAGAARLHRFKATVHVLGRGRRVVAPPSRPPDMLGTLDQGRSDQARRGGADTRIPMQQAAATGHSGRLCHVSCRQRLLSSGPRCGLVQRNTHEVVFHDCNPDPCTLLPGEGELPPASVALLRATVAAGHPLLLPPHTPLHTCAANHRCCPHACNTSAEQAGEGKWSVRPD